MVRKAEGVMPCRRKRATANKDEPKMRTTGRKTSKGDVKEVKTAERRKKTGPFAECPRRRDIQLSRAPHEQSRSSPHVHPPSLPPTLLSLCPRSAPGWGSSPHPECCRGCRSSCRCGAGQPLVSVNGVSVPSANFIPLRMCFSLQQRPQSSSASRAVTLLSCLPHHYSRSLQSGQIQHGAWLPRG